MVVVCVGLRGKVRRPSRTLAKLLTKGPFLWQKQLVQEQFDGSQFIIPMNRAYRPIITLFGSEPPFDQVARRTGPAFLALKRKAHGGRFDQSLWKE